MHVQISNCIYIIHSYEGHQYCVMQIKCNYCEIKYAAYLKIAHSYVTSFIANAVIKFQIYFTFHMCINRHIAASLMSGFMYLYRTMELLVFVYIEQNDSKYEGMWILLQLSSDAFPMLHTIFSLANARNKIFIQKSPHVNISNIL